MVRRPPGHVPARRYPAPFFLKSAFTPFPGVVFRRALGLSLGGFDPRRGPLADYDFWYRLACAGEVEVLSAIGAFYRESPGQWTARAWPEMLRQTHLLRLQIAREQLPDAPRFGRFVARFFTRRNARSYARRFDERPPILRRVACLGRGPFQLLPSGWAWAALKLFTQLPRQPSGPNLSAHPPFSQSSHVVS